MMLYFILCVILLCMDFGEPASGGFSYDGIDYMRDMEGDSWMLGGRMNKPQCIDIPSNLTLCRGIGYQTMRLPNLLDHDTINEVIQQSKSWLSLLRIHCHPDTQLFLCSLFSPVCLDDRTIYPCRSLCESVKAGCEGRMLKYGYRWPDMVKCDKFPDNVDLCINPQHNVTLENNLCQACTHPATREGLWDNSCQSGFVFKAKIRRIKTRKSDKILYLKKLSRKRIVKNEVLSDRETKRLSLHLRDGSSCNCDQLAFQSNTSFVIMGKKTADGTLEVTYITQWRNKDREFKKSVRKIKSLDCTKIVDLIENRGPSPPTNNNSNNNKRKRKKGGKRRNKKGKGNKKRRKKKKKRRKGKKDRRRPTPTSPTIDNNVSA